jgi:hypothetical protein
MCWYSDGEGTKYPEWALLEASQQGFLIADGRFDFGKQSTGARQFREN